MPKHHQPCPFDDCNSSDGFSLYDDGDGYCFSCKRVWRPDGAAAGEAVAYTYEPLRGVSRETMERTGTRTRWNGETPTSLDYHYPNDGVKRRFLKKKAFTTEGDMSSPMLFLSDKFPEGSGKAITITEGEQDALSVIEMIGWFPTVSVRSSTFALADCKANYDYLSSFDKIILCFDNDEQGQKATEQVATLFDFNKVHIVSMHEDKKDAGDYLLEGAEKAFKSVWWAARRYIPENILSSFSDVLRALEHRSTATTIPIPWTNAQEMTFGIRTGETFLITGLEGQGKTEIVRALLYHALQEAPVDMNFGAMFLEEMPQRTFQGLAGINAGAPMHLPPPEEDFGHPTDKDILEFYKRAVKREDRLHLFTPYREGLNRESILNNIRFLVASVGCRFIFFDHITKVVTGGGTQSEREDLEYISTKLDQMTKELDFGLVMVSHVNDEGQTRGSRIISKEAATWLDIKRNVEHPDPNIRNTSQLLIRKNRFGSETGPAGKLFFDKTTFLLEELKPINDEEIGYEA